MTGRFEITRDMLASGALPTLFREAREEGLITPLSDEAREANWRATLARHRRGSDLWIFGFGSLMWNPACKVAETRPAVVSGWHRRFCIWTQLGRATPDLPGLTLGLEPGGSCRGLALRIEARLVEQETVLIWRREMIASIYRPVWVSARIGAATVPAVSFAANRDHEHYAGNLPVEIQARHLGCAEGPFGASIEYLEGTVAALDSLGQRNGMMHDLLRAARAARRDRLARPANPQPAG